MGKLNDLLSKIITKLNTSVKTEVQSFSEEEKAQARENIGLDNIDFYEKNYSIYIDAVTGNRYIIEIRNGNLTSTGIIKSVVIAALPRTSYFEGVDTEIDLTGMVVEAVYEDGSSVEITDYTCSTSFDDLVDGKLIVSYEQFGKEFTASTEITFLEITGISITTPPTKTVYTEGSDTEIDLTGMVVEAVYEDGSSVEITDYTCSTSFDDLVDGQLVVEYNSGYKIYTAFTEMAVTLVSSLLNDFEYTKNDDGTYELTAWKGTLNGEASTEIVVPDHYLIVV